MGLLVLRWFGVFYALVGVLDLFFHDARGYEFGFLNVNPQHSAIHFLTGLVFVGASFMPRIARTVTLIYSGLFVLLIVFGIFPALYPLGSWVPLDGTVLWFHILTLIVLLAAYATLPKAATALQNVG